MTSHKNIFSKSTKQRGAASIFIVIFFTILVGVITVSFVRIVNNDRQQALNNDLSQSAYDSAQAGVEDGKRTLDNCLRDIPSGCKAAIATKYAGQNCQDTDQFGPGENEAEVKQDGDDKAFNQAYTCVKIKYNTPNYENEIKGSGVDIIDFNTTPTSSDFTLNWFNQADAGDGATAPNFTGATPPQLPPTSVWPQDRPPIMRLQIIQAADSGNINSDINNKARTFFFYPTAPSTLGAVQDITTVAGVGKVADLARTTSGDHAIIEQKSQPVKVKCQTGFSISGQYACSIKLISFIDTSKKNYLVISPVYGTTTHFEVVLSGGASFNGVQPEIDATGRAGDVFRRVKSRVSSKKPPISGYSFESAASICKAFGVTNDKFLDSTECDTNPTP